MKDEIKPAILRWRDDLCDRDLLPGRDSSPTAAFPRGMDKWQMTNFLISSGGQCYELAVSYELKQDKY